MDYDIDDEYEEVIEEIEDNNNIDKFEIGNACNCGMLLMNSRNKHYDQCL